MLNSRLNINVLFLGYRLKRKIRSAKISRRTTPRLERDLESAIRSHTIITNEQANSARTYHNQYHPFMVQETCNPSFQSGISLNLPQHLASQPSSGYDTQEVVSSNNPPAAFYNSNDNDVLLRSNNNVIDVAHMESDSCDSELENSYRNGSVQNQSEYQQCYCADCWNVGIQRSCSPCPSYFADSQYLGSQYLDEPTLNSPGYFGTPHPLTYPSMPAAIQTSIPKIVITGSQECSSLQVPSESTLSYNI